MSGELFLSGTLPPLPLHLALIFDLCPHSAEMMLNLTLISFAYTVLFTHGVCNHPFSYLGSYLSPLHLSIDHGFLLSGEAPETV